MTTRLVLIVSGAIEAGFGAALIFDPGFVLRLLLGAQLSGAGVAAARVPGFALLSLTIACWPGGNLAYMPAIRELFVYNLLVGPYCGYLRLGGGFASYLLWPACAIHILLALLLARPAMKQG
jgi:hypothetical protein